MEVARESRGLDESPPSKDDIDILLGLLDVDGVGNALPFVYDPMDGSRDWS